MAIEAGQRLGPYLLEQKLPGAGGMGMVFRARNVENGGMVYALKVIKADLAGDPVARARFDREARILQTLKHPNVIEVIDYDEDEGTPYIVTAFARDGDLRNFLGSEMTIAVVLAILKQAAEGLQAAHDHAIVHRDVKPENLLVERSANEMKIMVTDFGVAWGKEFSTHYTPWGNAVGTRGYMSPECQRGEEADCRADVYSLAICLNKMLGKSAHEGPIVAVTAKAGSFWPHDRQRSVMEFYEEAERALLEGRVEQVSPRRAPDGLAQTRMDTPPGGTLPPEATAFPAVLERVLARLGLQGQVRSCRLARGRSNPMLITGMLTLDDPVSLGPYVSPLANELAQELRVNRVQLVLLPSGQAVPDVVRTYFSVLFAEDVLPDDLSHLAARRVDDLLEIDVPPRVDRVCDEDVLIPLVAQLRVKRVRLNPIPVR